MFVTFTCLYTIVSMFDDRVPGTNRLEKKMRFNVYLINSFSFFSPTIFCLRLVDYCIYTSFCI